jgi:hypothetical protein
VEHAIDDRLFSNRTEVLIILSLESTRAARAAASAKKRVISLKASSLDPVVSWKTGTELISRFALRIVLIIDVCESC